jgi:hypothetical protein
MSKQDAAKVRAAIKKELGHNSRAVSVRSSGSALYLTIKDPTIRKSEVESIGNRARHVRYCEASGEILGGGNTFVFTEYSDAAHATIAAPHLEPVKAAFAKITGTSIAPVGDTGFGVSDVNAGSSKHGQVRVWDLTADVGGYAGSACSIDAAAFTIGRALLERGSK